MDLNIELPEILADFVRKRAAQAEQSPSDVIAEALMLLHDQDDAPEDIAWLREALKQVDPADEGEELNAADIIRDGEAKLSAMSPRR